MNQIGLVFEGGGGKGAYQIGVWKYLREKGLDRYVGGVSGTSVGALNAVLFAAGDYSTAERIWKNISRDQILSSKAFTNTLAGAGSQAALANIWRTVPQKPTKSQNRMTESVILFCYTVFKQMERGSRG